MQANLKFAPIAVALGLFALSGTAYAADVVQEEPPAPALLPQASKAAQEDVEREKIREGLQRAKGVRSRAAKLLGISRATLYNKIKRYRLDRLDIQTQG